MRSIRYGRRNGFFSLPSSRRAATYALATTLPLLAGCGGGGGNAAVPAVANPAVATPATTPSTSPSGGSATGGTPAPVGATTAPGATPTAGPATGATPGQSGATPITSGGTPIGGSPLATAQPSDPLGGLLPTPVPAGGGDPLGSLGGGTSVVPIGSGAASGGSNRDPVTVRVAFVLPAQSASAAMRRPIRATSSFARALQYVSPSTTTLRVTVTPEGGGPTVTTGSCTTGTCVASFTATPGVVTLLFELTDGTNTLARTSSTQIIQPNAITTLSFTANPVVDHVALALASPTVNAGTPNVQTLTVNAYDKANNIITGVGSFVDANGTPLLLTLSAVNNQAGGTGGVSFRGPMQLTAPGQAAIRVAYDGKWLDNSVISVASSRPLAGALGTATLTTTPTTTLYPCGCSNPHGMTAGPDGNVWSAAGNGNSVVRMTTSGSAVAFPVANVPNVIVAGPDGNMWVSEVNGTNIARVTPGGGVTEYAIPGGVNPTGIAVGPDGNIWFGVSSVAQVGRLTPGGAFTMFSVPATNMGIVRGSDGNMWSLQSNSTVARITVGGAVQSFATSATDGNTYNAAVGAEGDVWFPENGVNRVGRLSPGGAFTEYAVGGYARFVTLGPDGNIWAALQYANSIVRITSAGAMKTFAVGVAPLGITAGPDGNLWIGTIGGNIGKFVL